MKTATSTKELKWRGYSDEGVEIYYASVDNEEGGRLLSTLSRSTEPRDIYTCSTQ